MIYRSYVPAPPLAEFVERIWLCLDIPAVRRAQILPSGGCELVINLCEDEVRIYDSLQSDRCMHYSGAVFAGPYEGSLNIDPMQHASIVGVHFRPGGAFPFLGAPTDELTGMHVNLEILWGSMVGELRERLCSATTISHRFSLLENALTSRLQHSPQRHGAVSIALRAFEQSGWTASVHDVALHVGLSVRRFIRVFAAEVGLTPKLYCRIQRFQKARHRVQNVESPVWSKVAVECGYCDQSHLIRDFQKFAGLTPANYLRQSGGQVLPNNALPTN